MIRSVITAGVIVVLAGPVLAQSAAEKDAMLGAIAAAGCRVNAGNNASVLSAAGISEEAASVIVQELLNSGEAEIVGGDLVLKTGPCG